MFTQEEKDRLLEDVRNIRLVLTGNGHPETGVVFKVAQHASFVGFWQKFGWLILAGFAGVPCTVVAGLTIFVVTSRLVH